MKDKGNICPDCFSTKFLDGECRDCGFKVQDILPKSNALPAGTILNNRYVTGKVLGIGGFGIIYKAGDLETGGTCAIKEYAPSELCIRLADQLTIGMLPDKKTAEFEDGRMRFREEAQLLGKLKNIPEVVRIRDYFEANQTSYFSMDLLEGANLNYHIRESKGKLPSEVVTMFIMQAGITLGKIHKTAGIVHCDVSPENIYIRKDNTAMMIDFGNAKVSAIKQNAAEILRLKEKFAPLELYVSHIPLGPYTDVFSLAATYYYALTGVYLPTAVERLRGSSYIPLNRMNLNIPEYISAAVDQALVLDYHNRTQTMAAFVSGITKKVKKKTTTSGLPYMEVVAGPMTGTKWNLPVNTELQVGRTQQGNHIALSKHPDVSNPHFLISFDWENRLFRITDVSRNGTYVNGKRMEKNTVHLVNPSSEISLAGGSCIMKLRITPDHIN